MSQDPYDYRKDILQTREYFKNNPKMLAINELIHSLNEKQHSSISKDTINENYKKTIALLEGRVNLALRKLTESAIEQEGALPKEKYVQLMKEWSSLAGGQESGRSWIPFLILAIIIIFIISLFI